MAKSKQLERDLEEALQRSDEKNSADVIASLQSTIDSLQSQLADSENEYDLLSEVRSR